MLDVDRLRYRNWWRTNEYLWENKEGYRNVFYDFDMSESDLTSLI